MNVDLIDENDIEAGKMLTDELIANFDTSEAVKWTGQDMGTDHDVNGNCRMMYAKECPKCRGSHGVLWLDTPTSVVIGDTSPGAVYLKDSPSPESAVGCQLCGFKGLFKEWGPHEELKNRDNSWFVDGDKILALNRRKGTGREVIRDLHYYYAKSGVDKVVRWCVGPAIEKEVTDIQARQIARHLGVRYIQGRVKHREKVRTRDFVATQAMESL